MSTYKKTRRLAGLALLSALILSACGTAPAPQPTPPAPSPGAAPTAASDAERGAVRNALGQADARLVVFDFSDFS